MMADSIVSVVQLLQGGAAAHPTATLLLGLWCFCLHRRLTGIARQLRDLAADLKVLYRSFPAPRAAP